MQVYAASKYPKFYVDCLRVRECTCCVVIIYDVFFLLFLKRFLSRHARAYVIGFVTLCKSASWTGLGVLRPILLYVACSRGCPDEQCVRIDMALVSEARYARNLSTQSVCWKGAHAPPRSCCTVSRCQLSCNNYALWRTTHTAEKSYEILVLWNWSFYELIFNGFESRRYATL